jgi:hypothetical protein
MVLFLWFCLPRLWQNGRLGNGALPHRFLMNEGIATMISIA